MSSASDQTEKQMNSWAKPILSSCKICVKKNKKQQEELWRYLGKIIQQGCIWWSQQVCNKNIGTLQAMCPVNGKVQRSLF